MKIVKKAFSLIELSIVMLIIGIIIAGVTSGSVLVKKMRLETAKQLTKDSPAHSIPELSLWYESTLDESFIDSQIEDDAYVTTWHDINSQTNNKNDATRATADNSITYQSSAVNHLPALFFNGTASVNAFLSANVLPTDGGQFVIFLVIQSTDPNSANVRSVFMNGNSGTNGYGYFKISSGNRAVLFAGIALNDTVSANSTANPEIIKIIADNSAPVAMYVNGVVQTLNAPVVSFNSPISPALYIGNSSALGTEPWQGYIAEIIAYERNLKPQEITDIENYLSRKYQITLN